MLSELTISNFAIINKLEIDLPEGLIVLTGETGAGKSIIIDALDFLLGARSSTDLIKSGENKAQVEGIFYSSKAYESTLCEWFFENGFEWDRKQITISRELTSNGSKARINGSIANSSHLLYLREKLLQIHEQSSHIYLLKQEKQLELLDNFGGKEHLTLLNNYKEKFYEYLKTKKELETYKESSELSLKRVDFLSFELNEINQANITDLNEEEKLQEKRNILLNKKELLEHIETIATLINGTTESYSLLQALSQIKKSTVVLFKHDKSFESYLEILESMVDSIKDFKSFLSNYEQNINIESEKILEQIEDRLDLFYKLKKKYGGSLLEVLNYKKKVEQELDNLKNTNISLEELEQKFKANEKDLNLLAENLSKTRVTLIKDFTVKINEELKTLGFNTSKARELSLLSIQITPCELNETGKDRIEFLFSANVDEPPKPLLKVVSGGELSRISLAIKSLVSESMANQAITIVFDEIDAGISGEVAAQVAKKLYNLSKYNQVICITHNPIIAAIADKHFLIEKKIENELSLVSVKDVSKEEREIAIASLLTPENKKIKVTEDAVQFAKSLLKNASKTREHILKK